MAAANTKQPSQSRLEIILIAIIGVILLALIFLLAATGMIRIPGLEALFSGREPGIIYTGGYENIYLMNTDGSEPEVLFYQPEMGIRDLSWTTDGSYILFSGKVDSNWDLYRIDAEGKNLIRLTTRVEDDIEPVLSHDGTQIAFVSGRQDENYSQNVRFYELFVMNSDGSSPVKIAESNARCPSWGPDDNWILYSKSLLLKSHLYIITPDGSQKRQITPVEGDYLAPAWSPDGKYIAYFDDYQLKLLSVDGSTVWTLANKVAFRKPAWSPDGKFIAFTTNFSQIAILEVSTREVTQLTGEPGKAGSWEDPSWEPGSD